MQVREWVQFIRLRLPETLAVKVNPRQSFPVWVRPAESDGERVEFEIKFDGDADGEVQAWDIDMLESVVSDAVVDGEIETVPVQDSPFSRAAGVEE